jgi:hypothetical protein
MLGKILSTTFFPVKSFNEISDKSVLVRVKSGASSPFFGSSPVVLTGSPLKVICAILSSLMLI